MVRNIQFHKLKDLEAHAHSFYSIGLSSPSTRCTLLCHFDHGINGTVAHRGTMAFEGLTDYNKEAGRVKQIVLQLLLYEIWVEDRSEVGGLCCMPFDLRLKR